MAVAEAPVDYTPPKPTVPVVRNTADGWHECYCPGCDSTYQPPRQVTDNNGPRAPSITEFVAMMEAWGKQHEDCCQPDDVTPDASEEEIAQTD